MKKISVRMVTNLAMLIAIDIVLTRLLAINTTVIRISFGFVALAMCSILYGPVWGAIAGCVADFIGFMIFNTVPAPYYPPLLITIILNAVNYGLLLNPQRDPSILHTTVAALNSSLVLSLCVQTYWLTQLMNVPYLTLLTARLPQAGVMCVAQLIVLPVLVKLADSLNRRFRIYEVGA